MCEDALNVAEVVARPDPVGRSRGREVTVGVAYAVIDYFQKAGDEYGLSAEHMMSLYLRHIANTGYKVNFDMPKVAETLGDSL